MSFNWNTRPVLVKWSLTIEKKINPPITTISCYVMFNECVWSAPHFIMLQQQRHKADTCRQKKTMEKKSQKSQDEGIMVEKYILENGSDLYSCINSCLLYVAQICRYERFLSQWSHTQPRSAALAAKLITQLVKVNAILSINAARHVDPSCVFDIFFTVCSMVLMKDVWGDRAKTRHSPQRSRSSVIVLNCVRFYMCYFKKWPRKCNYVKE